MMLRAIVGDVVWAWQLVQLAVPGWVINHFARSACDMHAGIPNRMIGITTTHTSATSATRPIKAAIVMRGTRRFFMGPSPSSCEESGQNPLHHIAVYVGQPLVSAAEEVGELRVVQS